MSDYNERSCTNCGSYLHHEDDCPRASVVVIDEWDPDGKVMEYASKLLGSCNECGCATELGESICWDCAERISQQ